jgi:hypothetical protein
VQNALDALRRDLRGQSTITDYEGILSTRNFVQNPRITRTSNTRAVPPESTFSNTPSASALSARVQNALENLWSNLVARCGPTEPTLHSIGFGRATVPTQFVCSLLIFALTRGNRRNRFVSPVKARRRRGLTRGNIHARDRRN